MIVDILTERVLSDARARDIDRFASGLGYDTIYAKREQLCKPSSIMHVVEHDRAC